MLLAWALALAPVYAQYGAENGEWPVYAADNGATKYSPLDQINRENVARLRIAWTWTSADAAIQREQSDNPQIARATYFQCTPVMVDGVLYVSTSLSQAAAVDAATGETLWVFNPESWKVGRPPNLGYINRGVAYWEDGNDKRVYLATGASYLYALDARTGKPVESFGDGGKVDLIEGVPRATRGIGYGHPSAPVIVAGIVAVGSSIADGPIRKEGVPGQILGFDVRTGERLWRFNNIAQPGEFGSETWKDGSNEYTGAANTWSNISADDELGYLYAPTSTPTNDFYGGHRLGDNLFAEGIVCLDARTGKRVWHYQFVHHGLWDYDTPCAPNLIDIVVDGRPIKAVAAATKHGFLFVFDRVTGEPVWPIEERPVPQSTVPGEETSPTQPFPTKPAPFARQGVGPEDVIDFTPELREEALKILEKFQYGPLFTPPVLEKSLLILPGYGGGANWPGCAVDPETGVIYIPSMEHPSAIALTVPDPSRSNFRYTRGRGESFDGPQGLPLIKPPYAKITAINLNTGEHLWWAVNGGEGPVDHPAIKHLNLPPMGTNARAGAMVTKTLLFVTEGSGRSGSATGGSPYLRAFDKRTGEVLARIRLPDHATGVPMTYRAQGRQYVAVAVGANPAQLVALSLPD